MKRILKLIGLGKWYLLSLTKGKEITYIDYIDLVEIELKSLRNLVIVDYDILSILNDIYRNRESYSDLYKVIRINMDTNTSIKVERQHINFNNDVMEIGTHTNLSCLQYYLQNAKQSKKLEILGYLIGLKDEWL